MIRIKEGIVSINDAIPFFETYIYTSGTPKSIISHLRQNVFFILQLKFFTPKNKTI